jgi:hypothetical protein
MRDFPIQTLPRFWLPSCYATARTWVLATEPDGRSRLSIHHNRLLISEIAKATVLSSWQVAVEHDISLHMQKKIACDFFTISSNKKRKK